LALATKKGGGWHHVCYEVSALEKAMDHYRACGCFVVSEPAPAVAFPGRRIAWLMDANRMLFELVEAGEGRFSLSAILKNS
jgi:methylmalonyl-CoA/ethylmalonyl-CoA epimerase